MRKFIRASALAIVLGGSSLLGGCATQEAVEHAQATADSAKSDAAAAMSAAQAAAQKAADASASAQSANAKIDSFAAQERREGPAERRAHSGHRWHHHHHHHPMKK